MSGLQTSKWKRYKNSKPILLLDSSDLGAREEKITMIKNKSERGAGQAGPVVGNTENAP